MNDQIKAWLRSLADGMDEGTVRITSFGQSGHQTKAGQMYTGSLELDFDVAVDGVFHSDYHEELANQLNSLLEDEEEFDE